MAEPTTIQRDLRGLPLWLLRDYLIDLGGEPGEPGLVIGQGWTARLTQLPDYQIGSLRVGEVRLEVTGLPAALADLLPPLERRLDTRGGG